MEPTPRDILWLVGFPVLLAVVAMLAARPWRRGRDLGGWAAAVAIAGGLQFAFVNQFGVPQFPPATVQAWIFYIVVPLVLVAGAMAFVKAKSFAISASGILLGAIPFVMLRRFNFESDQLRWTWIAGGAVAMIAWWAAMEPLARRSRGGSLPLLLGIVIGVTGLAIIDGGIKTLGFATGSVAFPLFVVAMAATWSRGASVARGGVLTFAGLFGALLICGHLLGYPGVPILDLSLLALAPLAAWLGEVPGLGKADSWKRAGVRTVVVLAVLALPAFHAATGLKKTADETFDSYSY